MATISTHNGSTAHRAHNIRDKRVVDKQTHIDPNGVHETWKDETLSKAYHRLFDGAVAEYNSRQTREERKIGSYLSKVQQDGKKHACYEMIIGVYKVDQDDQDKCKSILKEFVKNWSKRNPNLELIGAYYHADEEGEPHVHLDYIPIAHNCKRGLRTQTALNKALEEMGFVTVHSGNTAQMQWERAENKALEEICLLNGITVDHPERDKAEHLETDVYKAQQELNKLQGENKVQSDFLEQTESKLFETSNKLFKRGNELRRTENRMEELKGQIEPLESHIDALKTLSNSLTEQNEQLEQEQDERYQKIKALDQELDKTLGDVEDARTTLVQLDKDIAGKKDGQRLVDLVDLAAQEIKNRKPYTVEVVMEHEPKYNPITKKMTKPATVEVTKDTFDTYLQDKTLIQTLIELLNRLLELFRSITESLRKEVVREKAYQDINSKLERSEQDNKSLKSKNMSLSMDIDSLKGDKAKLQCDLDEANQTISQLTDESDRLEERFPVVEQLKRICKYEEIYDNRNELGHSSFGRYCVPNPDGEEVYLSYFMKQYAKECVALGTTPREDIDKHYAAHHEGEHLLEAIADDGDRDRGHYIR